jgi:Zn-dependent protease
MNEGLCTALVISIGWLISLCLHEFGHAVVAYAGGDHSVKDKGYLTLNPLKYTDPGLTLVVPLIILMIGGVALPGAAVYINRKNLRNRFWHSLVSAAGPFANMCCLLALSFAFKYAPEADLHGWLWTSLALLALLQTICILLNLLPVPALDGYGIIEPWLPRPIRETANRIGAYGIWIVFAALWFIHPLNSALWQTAFAIDAQLQIPMTHINSTFRLFREQSMLLMAIVVLILIITRRHATRSS